MPIEAYKALDVGMKSDAANSLLSQVDEEAAAQNLRLTGNGDAGAMSANLTPTMSVWLNSYVAPLRGAAIAAIEAQARPILLPGGVSGIVSEIEVDRLKRASKTREAELYSTFNREHGAEVEKLKEVEREYLVMRTHENLRAPRIPSRLIDLMIPLGIMIPEGFMNYKFFFEYIGIGIVALGSTIVVGLGIGWSAFLAGRFLKAYHFYMGPDNDAQRSEGIRMISIAMTLLFVSLMAVGAVRYMGIARDNPGRLLINLPPLEPFSQTGMLLFGNLVVFGLGMAITYWLHDKNPLYAERAETFKKQEEKVERLRKRELFDKVRQVESKYKLDSAAMMKKADLMNGLPGYDLVRQQMGAVATKDAAVLGVLQEYRARLIRKLPASTVINVENGQTVDGAGFAALPINLYRC